MGQGRFGQQVQSGVVIHGLAVDKAAVAVVGVFAQADVRDHHQVRQLVLNGFNRALNDAVLGVGLGPQRIFFRWDAEKDDRRNAQIERLPGRLHQIVHGELIVAGHGIDGGFHPFALDGEQGQDQVIHGQGSFAHHPSQGLVATHPSGGG